MDGTTTTTSGGAGDEQGAEARTSEQPQLLATTALGDQCQNCGARLAPDQRYCLECGQRRGKPRYSLSGSGASTSGMSGISRVPARPRLSANGTLIAGVATLLLAMGVGVLIGRSSNSSSGRAGRVQVVSVAGAGSGTGAAAAATTPTTSTTPSAKAASSSASSSKSKGSAKAVVAKLQAKLPPKAKVIPKALKSKVAKVGSKCTPGEKGCTGGKFTGSFFGGGG